MLLLGCKPQGRFTEQHDIFFGSGNELKDLLPGILAFWPGPHKIHIDAWREVTEVDGYKISLVPKEDRHEKKWQLFFINLGGYKKDEFEEYHYKMLVVAAIKAMRSNRRRLLRFSNTQLSKAPIRILMTSMELM
jgi:hypothetical protein